jgi:hypothetical protein
MLNKIVVVEEVVPTQTICWGELFGAMTQIP